jgi:hypothetical protein
MKRDEARSLIEVLRARFEGHAERHRGIEWRDVAAALDARPERLAPLAAMEASGGEPDVVGRDAATGEFLFFDCSAETPEGRRALCFDEAALASRKKDKPAGSAMGMAAAMGVELLDEEQYILLQRIGRFDERTSSWIATPGPVRALGGALFGDRRYDRAFVYHNGAESYYGARGFRAVARA